MVEKISQQRYYLTYDFLFSFFFPGKVQLLLFIFRESFRIEGVSENVPAERKTVNKMERRRMGRCESDDAIDGDGVLCR